MNIWIIVLTFIKNFIGSLSDKISNKIIKIRKVTTIHRNIKENRNITFLYYFYKLLSCIIPFNKKYDKVLVCTSSGITIIKNCKLQDIDKIINSSKFNRVLRNVTNKNIIIDEMNISNDVININIKEFIENMIEYEHPILCCDIQNIYSINECKLIINYIENFEMKSNMVNLVENDIREINSLFN